MRPVIVVPVFNAAGALAACLESLERYLHPADRLLLADDASTDPGIAQLLENFVARHSRQARRVRRPQNLGFVGNVNAAMREAGEGDAVLLNSDTVVSPGWLDRIIECALCDARIATITPWSNNAEICSYPLLCQAAPMPDTGALERLARAAARLPQELVPELPTAVGFAMYLRRSAWEALGGFDEATFGRGYGEENDYCLRAAAHGWRNVLCPRAFVAHRGNASFSELGMQAGGENLRRLLARYPDYNDRIARFIVEDPLRPLREALSRELDALDSRPAAP
jgi:GT2 family glycosyltransferase